MKGGRMTTRRPLPSVFGLGLLSKFFFRPPAHLFINPPPRDITHQITRSASIQRHDVHRTYRSFFLHSKPTFKKSILYTGPTRWRHKKSTPYIGPTRGRNGEGTGRVFGLTNQRASKRSVAGF